MSGKTDWWCWPISASQPIQVPSWPGASRRASASTRAAWLGFSLPDRDEMRDMVISAFVTRSKEELDKLGAEIRQAQTAGADKATVQTLYKRFAELQAAAAEHEQLLSGSIDDAQASMRLVQLQLASLMARAS